jgi:hypothetical protein
MAKHTLRARTAASVVLLVRIAVGQMEHLSHVERGRQPLSTRFTPICTGWYGLALPEAPSQQLVMAVVGMEAQE